MKTIKPIQTSYKSYKFRSRLEARWAVYFDALGLDWEYEPEGFDLDGVWYLPDFRVNYKGVMTWYEVKPKHIPSDSKFESFKKMMIAKSFDDVLHGIKEEPATFKLVSGDPLEFFGDTPGLNVCPRCGNAEKGDTYSGLGETSWNCFSCDITTGSGAGESTPGKFCLVRPHKGLITVESQDELKKHCDRIKDACEKARAARFEHGETPNV